MARSAHRRADASFSKSVQSIEQRRKSLRRAVAMLAEPLESRVMLTAITWTGPANGNWNLASNWNTGTVPGGSDTVTIPSGASPQVTDSENAGTLTTAAGSTFTIASNGVIGIGGGTISGSVIDNGVIDGPNSASSTLTFAGSTTFQHGGVAGGYFLNTGNLTLNTGSTLHGAQFSSSGTIAASGSVGLGLNTTLTNLAGGIIDIPDGGEIGADFYGTGGSAPSLVNHGTIDKTGSSTGGFNADTGGGAMTLEDIDGTIETTGGTLQILGPGQFDGTTFKASAGASIVVNDANDPASVSYQLYGTVTGSGAGTLQLQGSGADTGTPTVLNTSATAPAVLNFPAGFAQVSGMFFQAFNNVVINQGTLTYVGSTTDGAAALDNKGTINVTGNGDFDVNRQGTFTNDTTGVLNFETDAGVTNDNGGTSFINDGLIEKTGGAGTSTIGAGTANIGFANDGGTFDVESGTLSIANGGGSYAFTIPSNGITAAAEADFDLGGAGNTGNISVQGNLTISGGGTFSLSGDYLYGPNSGDNQNTSSPATLNFDTNQFTVDGGGFGDNVNLINEGEINFSSGDMGTMLNKGTITLGSGVIVDSGTIINATGGVILSGTSDGIFRMGNNGNVQNAGVFVMSPGAGNTFDMTGTEIGNTGTLIFGPGTTKLPWLSNGYDQFPSLFPDEQSIPSGSIFQLNAGAAVDVDTAPSLTAIAGTVIMNAGSSFPALNSVSTITGSWSVLSGDTVSLTGGLTNSGTLSVGGSFTVNGAFAQSPNQTVASPPTPTLDFEVAAASGSANAPKLSVTGATTLAGNLTANYVDGYTGSAGLYTVAIFASAATGSFASTAGTAPFFTPSVSSSQIVLNATAFSGTGGGNPGGIAIPTGGTGGGGTGGGGSGGGGGGGTTTGSADLALSSVTAPESFTPGSSQTITWSVTNSGTSATSGSWQDSVFLSTDTTLSADDLLLGRVQQSSSIAAAAAYTGTLTLDMPAVAPGTYYVVVVVDSRETLSETSYSNNTAVSTAVTGTLPILTLGQTTTGTVGASQQQLFTLAVTAGESIDVAATFAAALEGNVYVSFNAIPTPQSYDQAATNPLQTSASLNLNPGQSGTYFVLLYGRPDIVSPESFALTPTAPAYGPDSISPTACANSGLVSLTIQGHGFTPSTTVSLISSIEGASDTPAAAVQYVSSSELYALFDFSNAVPGTFSVETSQGTAGPVGTLASALTINTTTANGSAAASPGQLAYYLSAPTYFRVSATGMLTLSYENIGGTDIGAPLFDINSTNASFALADDSGNYVDQSIEVLGDSPTGPAGLLSPGAGGSVTIYFQQDSSAVHVVSTFDADLLPDSTKTKWSTLSSDLKPVGEQDDAWNVTFLNFESLVGTTVGSYASVLDNLEDYLGAHGERTPDASLLLQYELQVAGNFGEIEQRYAASSFGRGIPDPYNVSVTMDKAGNAAVGDDEQYSFFLLQPNGTFTPATADTGTFTANSNGTYTLTQSDGSAEVFNSNGTLDYEQDSNGFRETTTISNGLVTAMTSADGAASFVYNAGNEVTSATDPDGNTTIYSYDSSGNLLTASNFQGTTTYVYAAPADHAPTQVIYPDGTELDYQYDAFGRVIQESAAAGAEPVTFSYDSFGNATQTDALGHTSTAFHGLDGQVVATEDGLGNIVSAGTTAGETGVTSITGPDGVQTSYNQNGSGQVTSATTPNGTTSSVTYNAQGLPSSITDPDGNSTTMAYDAGGDPTSITDAQGKTDTYTYNDQGETTSTATAAGRVVNGVYNGIGQLVSQTLSDGTTASYTYDNFGNVASATNSFGTVSFTYNAADLLTKVSYSDGLSLAYTYNSLEQITQEIDQNGFADNYAYNSLGQLVSVTNAAGSMVAQYTYDAAGNVSRVDDGNSTYTNYTYDADNRETSIISYAASGTILSSFAYIYNAAGEITSMTTLSGTTSYGFDVNGQLKTVNLPNGQTISYVYDAAGNRISTTESGTTTTYSTNSLNQYTTVGGTAYVYDADGNLISSTTAGVTATYTYNVENELTSDSSPSGTYTYQYDALGDRVATTVNGVTTYDLVNPKSSFDQIVGEYSTSGATIANYSYGLSLVSQVSPGTGSNYYDFDVQGNTAELTNSSGNITDSYSYLPFGQQLTSTGSVANPFTFSGQNGVVDQGGGFYLTRSRLYDAALGRFVQRDPGNVASGDTDVYRYVFNDPIDYIDPLGTGELFLALCQLRQGSESFFAEYANYSASTQMENFLQNVASNAAIINDYIQGTATPIAVKTLQWGRDAVAESAQRLLDKGITEIVTADGTIQVVDLANAVIADIEDVVGSSAADPVAYAQGLKTFAGEAVPAAAEVAGTVVTTTARTSLGFVTAPVQFAQAAFDYVLYYNKQFPEGTPVPEEEVLNLNSVYRRILKDPLGRLLLKAAASANPGAPVSQNTLNAILQAIAQSQRQAQSQSRGSDDPNSIIGPGGYGSPGFIPAHSLLPYQILFENDATASAPAAVVTITDQLSSNLDWSTFQLGDIGYGSTTITVPAGLQSYSTAVALTSALTLDITASFDAGTGFITWTFTTIDNATGDVPGDPSLGFLPPDVTPPQGEGFVDYTVSPAASAPTGATISAQASIVFDNNAAIATPTLINTIDAVAPTSTVGALASIQSRDYFTLNWSGSDDAGGSGIVGYTIFVSEDGGTYAPWLTNTTNTSAVYLAAPGHTYSFYSQAVDGAGNEQIINVGVAQATTSVPAIVRTLTFSAGKPARFTDAAGFVVTVSLSGPGTGTLSFISSGNADPVSLVLTGTTARSSLSIHAARGTLTLGTVSITGSLASFSAPQASFLGSFDITGTLHTLTLGNENITRSTLTISGTSVATVIRMGIVTDLQLTTASPIASLVVASWSNGTFSDSTLTAPYLTSLSCAGNFDPSVTITSTGLDVRSASIKGTLSSAWQALGSIGAISASNIDSTWVATVAGGVTSILARGNFSGSLTAELLRTLSVTGNVTDAAVNLTGTAAELGRNFALTTLSVRGSVTGSTLTSIANIDSVSVGGMTGSTLFAGIASGVTSLPTAASQLAADASIRSFKSSGRSVFSDSFIAAATLTSVLLANVTTNNNGTPFGAAAKAIGSLTVSQPRAKVFRYTSREKPSVLAALPGDLKAELIS